MEPLLPKFSFSLCSKLRDVTVPSISENNQKDLTQRTQRPQRRQRRADLLLLFSVALCALRGEFLAVPIRSYAMRESLTLRRRLRLFRMTQRHGHQMSGEKPDLQFIGPDHVAHEQVIRAIVSAVVSLLGHGPSFFQNMFVRFEEARNLHGDFFTPSGWTRNHSGFLHVRRHRQADASQQLNPLGNGVDELVLLAVMFVIQQMELIERGTRHLPMMFLVHIAKRHRVGENLVQVFDALGANYFVESDGQSCDLAEWLDFPGLLMQDRLCAVRAFFQLAILSIAFFPLADHSESPLCRIGVLAEFQSSGLRMRLRKPFRAGVSSALGHLISIRPWHFPVKETNSVRVGAAWKDICV